MPDYDIPAMRAIFGLEDGQTKVNARKEHRNLQWRLKMDPDSMSFIIGQGDLDIPSLSNISRKLLTGQQFIAYSEHHGTKDQFTHLPIILVRSAALRPAKLVYFPHQEALDNGRLERRRGKNGRN